MIYIYDLLVNFNENLIDFYDWEESDIYEHIRKCFLIKVTTNDYYNILTNNIKLGSNHLLEIKNKTQKFSGRNTINIEYALTITDGENAIIIKFDKNGISKLRSNFLINEEVEILRLSNNMKVSEIDYQILNKCKMNLMTRNEKRIVNLIINELNDIKEDKEKIDYLYYEWFDSNKGDNKYNKLINSISKSYSKKHIEFLDILTVLVKSEYKL